MSASLWALFGAGALTLALIPLAIVHLDEAWFLVVVKRFLRGDRLYEGVFFGAGPAPVWLAAGVVRLGRAQLLTLRVLSAVYLMAGLAVAVVTLEEAGVGALPVIALSVGAGGVHLTPFDQYGRWSMVLAMAAGAAVLFGLPWIAGLCVGLSIAGKYTTGLAAALTLIPLSILADGWRFASALAAGVLIAVLLVMVVMGRRGVSAFLDRAVRNKGVYLRHGGLSPLDGVRRLLGDMAKGASQVLEAIPSLVSYVVLAVAIAALPAGLVIGLRQDSLPAALGSSLCVVGLASAFPRFDAAHVRAAVPALALGIWIVFSPSGVVAATGLVLGLGSLIAFLLWSAIVMRRAETRRDVPGMRLLPATRLSGRWPDETGDLVAITGPEVFLFHLHAPAFYLSGGLVNPTPYDYPLVSTFGPRGQANVIAAVARGQVAWVCHRPMTGPLTATALQSYFDGLTPVAETGLGRVIAGGDPETGP